MQCHGDDYSCTCIDYRRNVKECLHLSLVNLSINNPSTCPFPVTAIDSTKPIELEDDIKKGQRKKLYLVKGDSFRYTLVWINKSSKVNIINVHCVASFFFCVFFILYANTNQQTSKHEETHTHTHKGNTIFFLNTKINTEK